MSDRYGWWTLATTVQPDDADLEHTGQLVRQGFTQGEICKTTEPAAHVPICRAAVADEE